MTIIIQASNVGNDSGPFNLFSQVSGFTEAFETDITKDQLLVGFVSYNVPDGTTVVRVMSNNPECTNYIDKQIAVPPSCPDKTLVFQICNANSLVNDNFDIYLNGINIGAVDLSQTAQVGSTLIADIGPKAITEPDFVCPLNSMTIYYFDPQLISNRNTIEMKNTQNNGNGNQGTIQIRNYKNGTGISLIEPCVVTDFNFSGASGLDFSFDFFYSECCPNEPL